MLAEDEKTLSTLASIVELCREAPCKLTTISQRIGVSGDDAKRYTEQLRNLGMLEELSLQMV